MYKKSVKSKGKVLLKIACILAAVAIIASALPACEKEEDTGTQSPTKAAATSAKATTRTSAPSVTAKSAAVSGTAAAASSSAGTGEQDEQEQQATETVTTDNGTEDTEEEPEDVVAEEKQFDLKGREIKVMVWAESLIPREEPGGVGGPTTYFLMKEAEEKFNCKFVYELIPVATYLKEITNAGLAGVYYCDMFRGTRPTVMSTMEKGDILTCISDVIDTTTEVWTKYYMVNGLLDRSKVYGIWSGTPLTPNGVWFNREILSREGIPDLKEYAKLNNWNYSTLIDVALKTTKDFDGNGVIDQWGLVSSSATELSIQILRSNLAAIIDLDKTTGKYFYNLTTNKALVPLQLLSDMYHTYKVAYTGAGITPFRNGILAMYFFNASAGISMQGYGLTDGIGWVTLPAGPNNPQKGFMREESGHFYFFPRHIPEPEATVTACVYYNILWDENRNHYLTWDQMIGNEAKRYFYNVDDYEFYMEFMQNYRIEFDYVEYFTPTRARLNTVVFTPMFKERISPYSMIESMRDEVQAYINDRMGY